MSRQPEQASRFKNGEFTTTPTGQLVSKVEKYNWKVKDAPGEFCWINKSELFVAPEYQRNKKSEAFVAEIARNWSWISCGVLLICEREEKWFVIDGQHRKLGADKRSDITKLPCLVFEAGSIETEARAFLTTNLRRSRISSLDTYRAQITAGDENSIFISSVLEKSGLKAEGFGSAKSVACISTLLRFSKQDREKFSKMWQLFTHVHQDCEIFSDVLRGLWHAEAMLQQHSKTLLLDPNFSKLIRIGGRAILGEIKRLRIERGKGGEAVCRDAVMAVLKKKI